MYIYMYIFIYFFFYNLDEPPIILNESEEEDSVINNILDPKRIQNVVENDIINSNQHTVKIVLFKYIYIYIYINI